VTFNDGEKIKVVNNMSHPMSTKVIRRHFDINSAGTLNATSAGVLNEVDSHAHTFMEEPRSKLFTGRIMMN